MSTLEPPSEVANNVVGIPKPQTRPFAVLIVERTETPIVAKVRLGSISQEERDILQFNKTDDYDMWWAFDYEANADSVNDIVHLAFSIGFVFRTEHDRKRWLKEKPFEMYRKEVREVA